MKFNINSELPHKYMLDRINLNRIPGISTLSYVSNDTDHLTNKITVLAFRVAYIIGAVFPISKFNININVYEHHKPLDYWFERKTKTIHLYRKFTEKILAHELCHALLHITFEGKMRKGTQEILCIYADKHLRDRRV